MEHICICIEVLQGLAKKLEAKKWLHLRNLSPQITREGTKLIHSKTTGKSKKTQRTIIAVIHEEDHHKKPMTLLLCIKDVKLFKIIKKITPSVMEKIQTNKRVSRPRYAIPEIRVELQKPEY